VDKIRRGVSRLLFHVARVFLVPIELLNPRLYMRVYSTILSLYGLHFEGAPRYISTKVKFDDFTMVSIGERAVISKYVILLTHDYSLTTALIALNEPPETDVAVNRSISIGSNVFVGMGSIILPGTRIGNNVIIGAGSVVRGDIPSDSIMIGNPAQRIGTISERAEHWKEQRDSSHAFRDRV
jgi:carbonic anhydrase/acetyltransferase-like protein (isoleucine patch superfamily)